MNLVIYLSALGFALMGIFALLKPHSVPRLFGVHSIGTDMINEVRAVYGGFRMRRRGTSINFVTNPNLESRHYHHCRNFVVRYGRRPHYFLCNFKATKLLPLVLPWRRIGSGFIAALGWVRFCIPRNKRVPDALLFAVSRLLRVLFPKALSIRCKFA